MIIISTLLALLALSGAGATQSITSGVRQPASQSDLKTPGTESSIVQSGGGGGYLGVYLGDVNEDRAKELSLKEIRGAVVGRIEDDSPAAKVGLRESDVILAFNQQRIRNRAHFHRLLKESPPGSKAVLEISRGGVTQNLEVVLGQSRLALTDERQKLFGEANALLATAEERRKQAEELLQKGDEKGARSLLEEEKELRKLSEENRAFIETLLREGKIQEPSRRQGYGVAANRYQLGLSVAPLSEQLTRFFNVARGGVLITEVRAGEPGERAGLKAGDCLVSINGEGVSSAADLDRLVNQKSPGELELIIVRDRNGQTVKLKPDQK
jgi:S1-C subfamily serine protease